ncbi:MAG: hypothetical protein BWY78_00590 [Alphaproteobacteria bacterium ADurb.Bin438]|nr:MAG: hypothetical protein BWY78_00590 [Alphaproteobacteria bacterium ADurb.Bin438]
MLKALLKSAVCCGLLMSFGQANAQVNVGEGEGLGNLPASPWQSGGISAVADTVAGPKSDDTLVGNKVPLPKFVGENTTWTKAQGQKAIAPEVNIANMLIMTDHLRKLGYQIPPGFDDFIRNSPEKLRAEIMGSLESLKNSGNDKIVDKSFRTVLKVIEDQTGFDVTNILETTFDLLESGPR